MSIGELPEFFTVEETARLLRVHPRTIRNRINAGLLPAKQVKGGKSRLIAKADVLGLLEDVVPNPVKPSSSISATLIVASASAEMATDDESASGEHLQKVQKALENNPVGFQRWTPKISEHDADKK